MANLVANPFQNLVVGPLALLLTVAFSIAGVGLALFSYTTGTPRVTRFWLFDIRIWLHNPEIKSQASSDNLKVVLWQRYRTWAIIGLIFAGAALSGPLALAGLVGFLIWQGGREYAVLAGLPGLHRNLIILGGWLTLAAVLLFGAVALLAAPVVAFFGWAALCLRPTEEGSLAGPRFDLMLYGLWGFLYLGWLPAHLVGLGAGKLPGLVLVVGLGVALSDIGAFCTGKLIGGPKLAPRLSPNKTWGGVPGNFLGAALAVALLGFVLPTLELWQLGLLALAIGLGSIWGDLLESLLKRQRGVKDAGALLPGFGGLLDRIDSLLLVAPLVYYVTLLIF